MDNSPPGMTTDGVAQGYTDWQIDLCYRDYVARCEELGFEICHSREEYECLFELPDNPPMTPGLYDTLREWGKFAVNGWFYYGEWEYDDDDIRVHQQGLYDDLINILRCAEIIEPTLGIDGLPVVEDGDNDDIPF